VNPHSKTQRVHPHARTQRLGERPDQSARKVVRQVIMLVILIIAGVGVYRLDPLDKWSSVSKSVHLSGKAHTSAGALAARIKDDRDCRKYRAEILAQDGKKGDAAELAMSKAYEAAKDDQCLNIDIE